MEVNVRMRILAGNMFVLSLHTFKSKCYLILREDQRFWGFKCQGTICFFLGLKKGISHRRPHRWDRGFHPTSKVRTLRALGSSARSVSPVMNSAVKFFFSPPPG